MGLPFACKHDRKHWRVTGERYCNYSSFNGGHRQASAYCNVMCLACGSFWRTNAKYLEQLPDLTEAERAQLDEMEKDCHFVQVGSARKIIKKDPTGFGFHTYGNNRDAHYKGCPKCETCYLDGNGNCLRCGTKVAAKSELNSHIRMTNR